MSKITQGVINDSDSLPEVDLQDEDYCFVFGPSGELKSVFLPTDEAFVAPKKIQKILTMYGITDIDNLNGDATLH